MGPGIGPSHRSKMKAVARVAAGSAAAVAVQAAAGAAVPAAMSTFGTVVAGVGTVHAPAAAGGIAALLQMAAAAPIGLPVVAGAAAAWALSE